MASGFLLFHTEPGREAEVLLLLARFPEVTMKQVLFQGAVAAKVEGSPEALAPALANLQKLAGVRAASLYPAKNA